MSTVKIILLVLSFFISPAVEVIDHDVHMSRCDIDYRSETEVFEISMKIFIDDLELDLGTMGHDSLKICTEHEKPEAEELIHAYLNQHLKIQVDNKSVDLEWVGKEISDDLSAVWCYLQVNSVKPTQSIDITNDVLIALYDDQQNVVKVVLEGGERSFFLFNKEEYQGRIDVD